MSPGIIQGQATFRTQITTNEAQRRIDCQVLALLAREGYEHSRNWLVDNLERIVPGADKSTLSEACGD